MLSRSSASPYQPDMPMQPSANGKTVGPFEPKRRGWSRVVDVIVRR
jgi:hypothetical protein